MGCAIPDGYGNALSLVGIYEISKILGSTLNLERALHDVLNILSSYLHMRNGAVVLSDGARNLEIAAAVGLPPEGDPRRRYPFQAVEKVVSTGLPLVEVNAAEEPLLASYVGAGAVLDDETVSFLCVPIKSANQTLGALSVERTWGGEARHVFEHDIRFLNMVATMIGQTVSLHRRIAADRDQLLVQNARTQKTMVESQPLLPIQGLEDVVGSSPAMVEVFAQVQQAAPTKATVLLRGESGTGKELVARAVHILSPRTKKPFVKVNCAALSESLLESELFGHEKGAFTGATQERKGRFELAHGGTLFLDEIGEISLSFQAKLLRVLQEGEFERVGGGRTLKVDVRLIAATNRNLEEAVAAGTFRADLYYRINVVPIRLPPLRERQGDIPLLAMYFLRRFNEENSRTMKFAPEALSALQRCFFPGNVRELENCVWRTATMTKGELIQDGNLLCARDICLSSSLWRGTACSHTAPAAGPPPGSLPLPAPIPEPPSAPPPAGASAVPPSRHNPSATTDPADPAGTGDDGETATPDERERLVAAMEKAGWVQAKAARLLGLTPRQIGYALRKHGISVRQF